MTWSPDDVGLGRFYLGLESTQFEDMVDVEYAASQGKHQMRSKFNAEVLTMGRTQHRSAAPRVVL